MKKKELQQLKEKTTDQLRQDLSAEKEKLRVLKFDLYSGKVKNVRAIRVAKRTIARMLTFIKMK